MTRMKVNGTIPKWVKKLVVLTLVAIGIYISAYSLLAYYELRDFTEESLKEDRFLTIQCNAGRLGNQMGLYATLLGISNLNNRLPFGRYCNMRQLYQIFNLSTPTIEDIELPSKYTYNIGSFLSPRDSKIPLQAKMLTGYLYPLSFTFFNHIRPKIIKEFSFRTWINNYAKDVLQEATAGKANVTLIGVHVRRTDYKGWLDYNSRNGREVGMEYFNKAMDYFRNKYKNALFIITSDDRNWCQEHFKTSDIFIVPPVSEPAMDMAIFAHCNHSIISYGSFGFWGAYLAGGETIYFADFLPPNSKYLHEEMPYNVTYLPNWIGISTTPEGYWNSTNLNS